MQIKSTSLSAHRFFNLCALFILIGFLMAPGFQKSVLAFDFDEEANRQTLRGLRGIGVVVLIPPGVEKDGLSRDLLTIDVELRLRKAGIKVFTIEEALKVPGTPFLSVSFNIKQTQATPLYMFVVVARVTQTVALIRNPDIKVLAATWSKESVGTVGEANLRDLRETVGDLLDAFINAYLAVNQ